MATDQNMSSWTDLLHSSTKLLEQAVVPRSSLLYRLLAREGLNAEQLARDLKSFELKATFEDVFPSEATTVKEYLQQVHQMTMVSALQEAQKDNLRSFNDYMLKVLEEDWQKEKRDFLQSLSQISTLPRTNMTYTSSAGSRSGQIASITSSPQVSSTPAGQ